MIAWLLDKSIGAWAAIRLHPGASLAAFALLICAILLGWLLVDRANLQADLGTTRADLAKVKDAQPAARAAQAAQAAQAAANHQQVLISATLAGISNAEAQTYYERGRAAGAAYAAANGVPASCPAGQPGHPDLPGADRPALLDDQSGDTAEMVALSRTDYDTLTGNSTRLAKVRQDVQTLIDAGVAVAMPDAPAP
jgi:hypothetical protein